MQTFGQYPKPRKNKKKQKKQCSRGLWEAPMQKNQKNLEKTKKNKKNNFPEVFGMRGSLPKSLKILFFLFFLFFLVFSRFFWFSVWELPKESLNIVFCVFFFFVFWGSFLVFFCMNKLIIFPRTKTIEFLVVSNEFYILNYLYTYSGHTYPPSESEYAKIVSLYCKYQ